VAIIQVGGSSLRHFRCGLADSHLCTGGEAPDDGCRWERGEPVNSFEWNTAKTATWPFRTSLKSGFLFSAEQRQGVRPCKRCGN
jgi:hypothetical protein